MITALLKSLEGFPSRGYGEQAILNFKRLTDGIDALQFADLTDSGKQIIESIKTNNRSRIAHPLLKVCTNFDSLK